MSEEEGSRQVQNKEGNEEEKKEEEERIANNATSEPGVHANSDAADRRDAEDSIVRLENPDPYAELDTEDNRNECILISH